jgi:hypothetical protein
MEHTRFVALNKAMVGILLGSCLLYAWGCGRKMGPTVRVQGKVTLDGQPFSQGCVWFSSAKSGAGFHGNLRSDGTYSVSILDVRPGETYGVFIGGVEPDPKQDDANSNPAGLAVPPVPAKYRESATSGLKLTLDGAKTQTFDIELKSR